MVAKILVIIHPVRSRLQAHRLIIELCELVRFHIVMPQLVIFIGHIKMLTADICVPHRRITDEHRLASLFHSFCIDCVEPVLTHNVQHTVSEHIAESTLVIRFELCVKVGIIGIFKHSSVLAA